MELRTVDHPLVAHKLTLLRDERTESPTFRRLTEELVTLLAYEATRQVRVVTHTVQTPLQPAVGVKLATPRPLVVPPPECRSPGPVSRSPCPPVPPSWPGGRVPP